MYKNETYIVVYCKTGTLNFLSLGLDNLNLGWVGILCIWFGFHLHMTRCNQKKYSMIPKLKGLQTLLLLVFRYIQII